MPPLEFKDPNPRGIANEIGKTLEELTQHPEKWIVIQRFPKESTAHSLARRLRNNTYTPDHVKSKWTIEALAQKNGESTEVFVRLVPNVKPKRKGS